MPVSKRSFLRCIGVSIDRLARLTWLPIGASLAALAAVAGCAPVPASVRTEIAKTPREKVTIVEFVDFECPFCRRMHAAASPSLRKHAGEVRIVRKQVPLSFHPHAEPAARVFLCAEEEGARVEELADVFFTAPPEELALEPAIAAAVRAGANELRMNSCVQDTHITTRILSDRQAFADASGEGVPLTYVGKHRLDGMVGAEAFDAALEEELGGTR